jgi:aryl hydrocarbon receptor nuclear translocator-like protein 1
MSPDQMHDAFDAEPKQEINLDEDSDDDDDTVKSLSNTKADKMRRISHSEIERRRREKMNRYIDEIAQLLPIDPVKKLDKLTVLRVAVDTVKHLKGTSSKLSSSGFGKQIYLDDNELLELTLATITEMDRYFFLIIECQKGRICYASNSVETILGCKPTELCLQSIYDIVYPSDIEIIKQQLINEKKASPASTDDSPTDSKCVPTFTTKQNCLEIGNRRTFSCRINSRKKRSNRTTTTNPIDNYFFVDFVGYIKQYSLTNDNQNDGKIRTETRRSNINTLTPSDVLNAIGTNPTTCLIAMGNLAKRLEKSNSIHECTNTIDRMFSCKLNPDGQFTYFDQICYPLLGYSSQDLLGMNLKDFIHEDDRNKVTEIWNRVCRDHQIVTSGSYRFRTKDNVYIILQTIFEPFINPWNDELEIIVARNKTKTKSVRTYSSVSSKNDNPRSVDMNSPTTIDSNELIRQLLP